MGGHGGSALPDAHQRGFGPDLAGKLQPAQLEQPLGAGGKGGQAG
jgi:hypothetical protein